VVQIVLDLEASTLNETVKKVRDLKQRMEMTIDKYKRLNLDIVPNNRGKKAYGKLHCKVGTETF